MKLKDRTIIITGASRGIGRSIALACAKEGANIVIAAKSAEPHPKLPGTIHSVAEEVRALGVKALPLQIDVREESQIIDMVAKSVAEFGRIDVLINNAGAISLTNTEQTPAKRYDLMHQINGRAVFLCTQACLPYLKKSDNAHVINLSPPISLDVKWVAPHSAYTASKYTMSLYTLGMAAEFAPLGISVNSLWPKTIIDTAAVEMLGGDKLKKHCRKPEILSDAVLALLTKPKMSVTGKWLLDESFLKECGVEDFSSYACVPGEKLFPDLYI